MLSALRAAVLPRASSSVLALSQARGGGVMADALRRAIQPLRIAQSEYSATSHSNAAAAVLRADDAAAAAAAAYDRHAGATTLLPALAITAWSVLPDLIPSILLVGKGTHRGKNKRPPKKANHGARPCSHVGRRQRKAAAGKLTPPKPR